MRDQTVPACETFTAHSGAMRYLALECGNSPPVHNLLMLLQVYDPEKRGLEEQYEMLGMVHVHLLLRDQDVAHEH